MRTVALILDLDNTLYCWMDAFAPGLDAQITYIAKRTGLTKKCIRENFKKVFYTHGSVEVVNAVTELDVWQSIGFISSEIEDIMEQSTKVFFENFTNNLTLFPTVLETLEWAKRNRIKIFAFSEGRAFWIDFRLKYLNIADFFEKIFVLEDEPDKSELERSCKQIVTLPLSKIKPNTYVIDEVMKDYNVLRENVYIVGDSKNKDIRTAKKAGVNNIWAQYGRNYSTKSRRLLSAVTPWTRAQKVGGHRIVPQHSITKFDEIIDIIKI